MITKEAICEAFCREVEVRRVPAGQAIRTPFESVTGDAIGFYIVSAGDGDRFRLEDDGTSVPLLESLGVNLNSGRRAELFQALLHEYELTYDKKTGEIRSHSLAERDIPAAAIRFVAGMLRLQDFAFLDPRTVEAAFREDANKAIEAEFAARAIVRHEQVVSERLKNYVADTIIEARGHAPVVVYYGTSDNRINEAVLLWMESRLTLHMPTSVLLLLETARPRHISERTLAPALNHLDAVTSFRGEEVSSLKKIASHVFRNGHALQS